MAHLRSTRFHGNAGRPAFRRRAGFALAVAALAASGWSASALSSKPNPPRDDLQTKPWVHVSLESLGFPGISDTFLQTGASMLTVHLLDDSHLLVSFSLRDLVPRIPGDPPTDDDRMVAAEIVDLPSGKLQARTVWHLHDHGRYLWSLGGGRFLVRIGDRLSSMAPLANLTEADPFQRTAFPGQQYRPSAIFVSPDGRLITIESVVSYVNPDGRAAVLLGDVGADQPVTQTIIQFFRVRSADPAGSMLDITPDGRVLADQPIALAVDADGYLGAEETARNVWSMSFDEFGGKTLDLGKLQSSCAPRLQMVSRGEFVAFSCRGGDSSVKVASYGLDGHETWEEAMGDVGSPVFAFAPAAARFAMSHATAAIPGLPTQGTGGSPARQEVRVYQDASGDLLLKAECSPVLKSAENFDLSADGLLAAVVRDGQIDVYKLPPPSKVDLADMAEVAAFSPPPAAGPVSLARPLEPADSAKQPAAGRSAVAGAKPPVAASPAAGANSAAGTAAASPALARAALAARSVPGVIGQPSVGTASRSPAALAAVAVGPSAPPAPARTPPTLLKPGEKPEFGASNAAPNLEQTNPGRANPDRPN